MKKRHFNFKNVFTIFFLAVAGLFGVTAAVVNKQVNEQQVVEEARAYKIDGSGNYERVNGTTYRIIYFTNRSKFGTISESSTGLKHFGHGDYHWRYKYTTNSSDTLNNGNGVTVSFGATDETGNSFNEIIGDFTAKIYLPQDVKKIKFRIMSESDDSSVKAETLPYTLSDYSSPNDQAFILTTNNYSYGTASTGSWVSKSTFDGYFYTNYFTVTGNFKGGNSGLASLYVKVSSSTTGTNQYTRSTPIKENMLEWAPGGKIKIAKFLVPSESGAKIRMQAAHNTGDGDYSNRSPDKTIVSDYVFNVTDAGWMGSTATVYYDRAYHVSYWMYGLGSFIDGDAWEKGLQMIWDGNDNNAALTGQYLEAGDVFNFYNGSSWYGINKLQTTSPFDRAVTGNVLYTINGHNSGDWDGGTWVSSTYDDGPTYSGTESLSIYVKIDDSDWVSSSAKFGIRSFNTNKVYVGYLISGEYGSTELVVKCDVPSAIFNNGFQICRMNSTCTEGGEYSDKIWNYSTNCESNANGTKGKFGYNDNNFYTKTTGYYDIYINTSNNIYIYDSLGGFVYLDFDQSSADWTATETNLYGAYFWHTNDNTVNTVNFMTQVHGSSSDYLYESEVPKLTTGIPNRIVFVRVNPTGYDSKGEGDGWWLPKFPDGKYHQVWNQTTDVTFSDGINKYNLKGTKTDNNYDWDNMGLITYQNRADYYGKYFNDLTIDEDNGVCDYHGGTNRTALDNVWSILETEYNNMSIYAQGIVWLSEANQSGSELQHAMATYEYIITKYGITNYPDYINRGSKEGNPLQYLRSNSNRAFIILSPSENNLSIVIIIIASSISLLSITALSVLVVKKKKRAE